MDSSFGARLRAQRERQHVTLSTIAQDTKIKLSMLEGLERDDVSQWPEGIYRRAYVRAYARAIGFDPETLVREFLEVHPDPVVIRPENDTELEDPRWPLGFKRLVTMVMAAVPARRQRDEQQCAEPIQPEPKPPRVAPEPPGTGASCRPELGPAAAAELCTRLGRVVHRREVAPILEDAARALDAVGLIVWSADSREGALRPSLSCGYDDSALARMAEVRADADNAIAAAFRSARACVVTGSGAVTGALVVPLISASGCVGVLAIELRHGDEQRESVSVFATIMAAQLVTLVGSVPLAEAVNA